MPIMKRIVIAVLLTAGIVFIGKVFENMVPDGDMRHLIIYTKGVIAGMVNWHFTFVVD